MRDVLHVLGGLGEEDIEWIVHHAIHVVHEPGTAIVRHGELPAGLIIVLAGVAVATSPDGRELAVLAAGSVFGERALVAEHPSAVTVSAREPTHTLRIDRDTLLARMTEDDSFRARILGAVASLLAARLKPEVELFAYAASARVSETLQLTDLEHVTKAGAHFDHIVKTMLGK